jgi:hypothetical protein
MNKKRLITMSAVVVFILIFIVNGFCEDQKDIYSKSYYLKKEKFKQQRGYDPIKKYVKVKIENNSIMLTWNKLNEIEEDDLIWDNEFKHNNYFFRNVANPKVAGYLVCIYEKNKKYQASEYVDPMYPPIGIDQHIYLTSNECLKISDLNVTHKYYIQIKFLIEGELGNYKIIGMKRFNTDTSSQAMLQNELVVSGDQIDNSKLLNCSSQIEKVPLASLNKNKESYDGKIIEIEGYIDTEVESATLINKMEGRSDRGITDGQYGIYVGNLSSVDYELLLKGREDNNYFKMLVYFSIKNDPDYGPKYRCTLISILDISRK